MSTYPQLGGNWWVDAMKTQPEWPESKGSLTFVDLFSGVGGLSLGFKFASLSQGYTPTSILACDLLPRARAVYEQNFSPSFGTEEDVTSLTHYKLNADDASFAEEPKLAAKFAWLQGKVDVVLAGPPCQGHSNLNNKTRRNDPRNRLYLEVPAFAIAAGARIVIIENVPGVVFDQGGVVDASRKLLEAAGYFVQGRVLSADKLGWPQTRSRFFLIATKAPTTVSIEDAELNFGTGLKPHLSWLIGDLQDEVDVSHGDVMLRCPPLSSENQVRLKWFTDNPDERNLPNSLRPPCQQGDHTRGSSYGRMSIDKPSPTLTTGLFTPGRGRFVHPTRERMLSAREAARIQGFPDWFQFGEPGRTDLSTWIGNAVPSILGYAASAVALGSLN